MLHVGKMNRSCETQAQEECRGAPTKWGMLAGEWSVQPREVFMMICTEFRIYQVDALAESATNEEEAEQHLRDCALCRSWLNVEESSLGAWQKQNQALLDDLLVEKVAQDGSHRLGLPSLAQLDREIG